MFKSQFSIGICLTFVILILTFPNISDAEIKVYDNNNQYLGILLNMESTGGMTVFIPSINASYSFSEFEIYNPDWCSFTYALIFESQNCSGTPYIQGSFPNARYFNCQPLAPGYYIPDTNSPGQFVPKSYLMGGTNGNPVCSDQVNTMYDIALYEAKQVQLPFTTPIALPVRFENVANASDFFVIPVKKK